MNGPISVWRSWRDRKDILQDIRRQQRDDAERDKFLVKDNLTYALSALERDDRIQAAALWTQSLDLYPNETHRSPLALRVLLGLRRFDEAEELMKAGRKQHPREIYFARGLAQVAQAKGDHDAAIEYWAVFRKQFPGALDGYTLGAESLMARNRLEEAEELAKQAMAQFSNEMSGFLEYARIAVLREDWEEVLRRCKPMRDPFDYVFGYVGAAQALVHLGRFDEADAILRDGRTRFPTDAAIALEFARTAAARGDFEEAIVRWNRLAERFPLHIHSCLAAADALEKLGAIADAEHILREAVEHFPLEARPLSDLGRLLFRHRNFQAAADVWAAMRRTFPQDVTGYVRGAEALRAAGLVEEAKALDGERRQGLSA